MNTDVTKQSKKFHFLSTFGFLNAPDVVNEGSNTLENATLATISEPSIKRGKRNREKEVKKIPSWRLFGNGWHSYCEGPNANGINPEEISTKFEETLIRWSEEEEKQINSEEQSRARSQSIKEKEAAKDK